MTTRIGGFRRRTRKILAKHFRRKGKISIPRFYQIFQSGDKVALVAEVAYHKGMYDPKFHGKVATVTGKRGTNYEVQLKDGGKLKTLIVHPVHLLKSLVKTHG